MSEIPTVCFLVFDASGPAPWPILRKGMCQADIMSMQGGPDDGVIVIDEATYDAISDLTHRVAEGGTIVAAPPALPPIADPDAHRRGMEITPRQLFIALASPPWSYITADEAVAAAMTGTMPAAVEAAIAGFDAAAQLAARVTWARMQVVLRLDPLVAALGASQGASDAELDDFFAYAATL